MTQVRDLITRVETYAKRAKLKQSTVSRKVFLDSSRLKDLKSGKSRIWPETIAEVEKRLAGFEAELEALERVQ